MFILLVHACWFQNFCDPDGDNACITTEPSSLDCASVAILDAVGAPDACDRAACESCVDNCGDSCVVLESYPPQYSCGEASWDVYDQCAAWQQPGDIYATDIENLSCGEQTGGEALSASSTQAGRIDVRHVDYGSGCCPQEVAVHIVAATQQLDIEYSPVNDFCECTCQLDVNYAIEGVPAGDWTLNAGYSGASATVTVL